MKVNVGAVSFYCTDPTGLDGEDCSACKEVAKKVAKKVIKMELKTFDATDAERTQAIQKGMQNATANPSLREYKPQIEQAQKREDDSVDPFSKWLRKARRRCGEILGGN